MIQSEAGLSSCTETIVANGALASFAWGLSSAAEEASGATSRFLLQRGRDPRTIFIDPYVLGFAGSVYVFQLNAVVGGVSNTVNATGEPCCPRRALACGI